MLAVIESGVLAPLVGAIVAVFACYLNFGRNKKPGRHQPRHLSTPTDPRYVAAGHECRHCFMPIREGQSYQWENTDGRSPITWWHQDCYEAFEGEVLEEDIEILRPEDTFWLDVVGIPIDNWYAALKPAVGFMFGRMDEAKLADLITCRERGDFLLKPEPITALVESAPAALDTLGELADALTKQEITKRVIEKTGKHYGDDCWDDDLCLNCGEAHSYRDAATGRFITTERTQAEPSMAMIEQLEQAIIRAASVPQLILSPEPSKIEPIHCPSCGGSAWLTHPNYPDGSIKCGFCYRIYDMQNKMIKGLETAGILPNPGIKRKH